MLYVWGEGGGGFPRLTTISFYDENLISTASTMCNYLLKIQTNATQSKT